MKITREDLKNYFPKSRRFLHFCAKHYGYSFYNDEIVETANDYAIHHVMKFYNKGVEFDDEAHKTAMVMSSFRFAILNAYDFHNRKKNKVEVRNETELTYSYGDNQISYYELAVGSTEMETNNLIPEVRKFLKTLENSLEREIGIRMIEDRYSRKEMSNEMGITEKRLELAHRKVKNKIKNFIVQEQDEQEKNKNNHKANNSASRKELRKDIQGESTRRNEIKTRSYTKAMSFLYS